MPQVKCKICHKKFYAKPSHQKLGWGKYCSIKCRNISQLKGKFVNCHICGKKIWKAPKALEHSKSGKFFCSKSCQTLWRNQYFSGPKHPNWRGGRYSTSYRKILFQSGATPICRICGQKDKRVLLVHHINKNRNNNVAKNLVWLCWNCHRLVHYYNEPIPRTTSKRK